MNSKILTIGAAWVVGALAAYAPLASGDSYTIVAQAAPDGGYRVGDTLAPTNPPSPSGGYEEVLWDALLPEGWNADKLLESLNLNELGDSDPKAKEVMKKIREMWDSAPVNSKLDYKRIRIPGFVVPLDGEREKTRDFLLVPYFGACIHAPAPPANQVIHVKVKGFSAVKLSPASWISGTIRTVRSDTSKGVTDYEMTLDKAEPYKQEVEFPI